MSCVSSERASEQRAGSQRGQRGQRASERASELNSGSRRRTFSTRTRTPSCHEMLTASTALNRVPRPPQPVPVSASPRPSPLQGAPPAQHPHPRPARPASPEHARTSARDRAIASRATVLSAIRQPCTRASLLLHLRPSGGSMIHEKSHLGQDERTERTVRLEATTGVGNGREILWGAGAGGRTQLSLASLCEHCVPLGVG